MLRNMSEHVLYGIQLYDHVLLYGTIQPKASECLLKHSKIAKHV